MSYIPLRCQLERRRTKLTMKRDREKDREQKRESEKGKNKVTTRKKEE